ncbi:MAG: 2-amino-4-hydroxy-6-hydroxymethyldihydropteridine diphosphokinase [Bacteroidales bacterium]|jgi:2-amino-4-hydroxy-6-hydroxymethyldihydropteridine diphosphokinase|nr:2-amino-4-hydroxy-6-hydroxymethyldihydropteridine diphosphokinase [Bacteroidales bacterium]
MHKVYFLVGGNVNNTRLKYEQLSILFQKKIGKITASSQFYKSPPWGFNSPNPFINWAVCVETHLTPPRLMKETQHIERLLGRKKNKTVQYEDRSMDIDIIFYDNISWNTEDLHIPHPKMHLRNFVLTPLFEICPFFVHPVMKKDITVLKKECQDNSVVTAVALLE